MDDGTRPSILENVRSELVDCLGESLGDRKVVERSPRCDDTAFGDGGELQGERRIDVGDRIGQGWEGHGERSELAGPFLVMEEVTPEPESAGDLSVVDAELGRHRLARSRPESPVRVVAAYAFVGGGQHAAAAGQATKPVATEVGVTDTEIHIAVIADVDNPLAPNVAIGVRDAVQGFAEYVNASCRTRDRCLADRKLVVDFYDSHLNPNDTRNAEIRACTNDFAAVGTAAVTLTTVDDIRGCTDQAGAATGLPDIPDVPAALVEQCSDESFSVLPPTVHCDTRARHPQTYDANVARGYYFTQKYGNLHGVYILTSDIPAVRVDVLGSGLGGLRDLRGTARASTPTPTSTSPLGARNRASTRPSST